MQGRLGAGQGTTLAHATMLRGSEGLWLKAPGWGWGTESRRQCSASPWLCSSMNKRFLHRKGQAKARALEMAGLFLSAQDWCTGWEEASCGASGRPCTPAHFTPAPPQGLKQ